MKSLKDVLSFNGSDPNKDLKTFEVTINNITAVAHDFAFAISVIMIMYSAFLYVTAMGEESKAENAKKTLTWSIVGFIVIMMARVILSVINNEVLKK